jgi:hypothetical protein
VVVVPHARIDAVIKRLVAIRSAEAVLLAKVQGGLGVPDWVNELLSGRRVEELD